uniref:Uncharacterized protein n=1 Tax=Rhizophora mucronata TaxID=61149 RepID=A0A2P2PIQ2_RHIMU
MVHIYPYYIREIRSMKVNLVKTDKVSNCASPQLQATFLFSL